MAFSVVVLAAGKGTRMKSSLPKVLHPIGGKPMVQHVIDTVNKLGATNIHLVYGHGREQLQNSKPLLIFRITKTYLYWWEMRH